MIGVENSIFSFSHNVFKRTLPQGRKNQGLFGKWLTAKVMAVSDAQMFPGFLTAVLTQLYFKSYQLLFSHASKVRGLKYAGKKVSNSQPHGHKADTLTTEPSRQAKDGQNGGILFHSV